MNGFIEPLQIVKILWRHLWLLIAITILSGYIGFQVSSLQDEVYQATSTLMVGRIIESTNIERTDIQLSEQLTLTYADLAKRQPVLQAVVDSLNLNVGWYQLAEQVTAKPIEQTQLIAIQAKAESAEMAQEIANETAAQLIQVSPSAPSTGAKDGAEQFVIQRLTDLQASIENGQQRLNVLRDQISNSSNLSVSRLAELQEEARTLETLLAEWDGTYARLFAGMGQEKAVNNLSILEPARAELKPVHPRVEFNTVLAAMIGLLFASSLLLLRDLYDDTLRDFASFNSLMKVLPQSIQLLTIKSLGAISKLSAKEPSFVQSSYCC